MKCTNPEPCDREALLPSKGVTLCKVCRIAFLEGYMDGFKTATEKAERRARKRGG